MKNGQFATVIEDRSAMDIDVQFEDGYIVKGISRANFNRGVVHHPKFDKYDLMKEKASCLGVTVMQKCGMKATCINYRKYNDIDVEFEDGGIAKNKTKRLFFDGQISNPNLPKLQSKINKASCAGLELKMNNGQKAICIAYRGTADIDVKFEDGTIVEHRSKKHFLEGAISNPNFKRK